MRSKKTWIAAAAVAAVALAPLVAGAREESKIRLFMEKTGTGNAKGMLRSDLAPGNATLRVHVNRLAPNLEHILYGDDVEVTRFMTNASGNAEVRIDLFQTGGDTTPTFDPRGKLLTINDGTSDVLEAWVYADPADDPARPRIKELTSLARDPAVTQGSVDARYDALPSGGARLVIALRGVAPGDYDVVVDDVIVATVTPNPSGFASVDLRVRPGNGMGNPGNGNKPHKQRGALTVNPRGERIEIRLGADVPFAGDMLAQIPGLGVCTETSADSPLAPGTQPTATGNVSLTIEEGCDLHMTLTLGSLTEATYDLWIAGADVGDIAIDASGMATLEYDDEPDLGAGELEMPAGVELGAAIPIAIEIRSGADVVLSGTLP